MHAAERHRAQWEAVARQRLDEQMFGASGVSALAFQSGTSRVVEGTDGATVALADLVLRHRALLESLEQPCAALALVRERLARP